MCEDIMRIIKIMSEIITLSTIETQRCQGIFSSGKVCQYKGKTIGIDGKLYCGHHVPKSKETLQVNSLIDINTIDRSSTQSHKPSITTKNEYHKNILLSIASFVYRVLKKTIYTLILMTIVFMIHLYGKSYYYHHCDSNLLKAFLFKKSSTCQTLGSILQQTELLFMSNVSIIIKYWMVLANEISVISTLFSTI